MTFGSAEERAGHSTKLGGEDFSITCNQLFDPERVSSLKQMISPELH